MDYNLRIKQVNSSDWLKDKTRKASSIPQRHVDNISPFFPHFSCSNEKWFHAAGFSTVNLTSLPNKATHQLKFPKTAPRILTSTKNMHLFKFDPLITTNKKPTYLHYWLQIAALLSISALLYYFRISRHCLVVLEVVVLSWICNQQLLSSHFPNLLWLFQGVCSCCYFLSHHRWACLVFFPQVFMFSHYFNRKDAECLLSDSEHFWTTHRGVKGLKQYFFALQLSALCLGATMCIIILW